MLNDAEQQVPNGECCAVVYRFVLAAPAGAAAWCAQPIMQRSGFLFLTPLPLQMPAPDSSSHGFTICCMHFVAHGPAANPSVNTLPAASADAPCWLHVWPMDQQQLVCSSSLCTVPAC